VARISIAIALVTAAIGCARDASVAAAQGRFGCPRVAVPWFISTAVLPSSVRDRASSAARSRYLSSPTPIAVRGPRGGLLHPACSASVAL